MATASATRVGTVRDVSGSTVSVTLDGSSTAGTTFVDGMGYRVGQVGSFARIPVGYSDLYGMVTKVGVSAAPAADLLASPYGDVWMTIELVGEVTSGSSFQRGVGQFPTINDPVHLVTMEDLSHIYGDVSEGHHVRVGRLAGAEALPAVVDANKLVARHVAVLGSTGSGKSTTVASILGGLCDRTKFPSSRALIVDLHGEYASAFGDDAAVFTVGAEAESGQHELRIPYWALTADELISICFGKMDDASHEAVADRLRDAKIASLAAAPRDGLGEDDVTADSPVPFSIHGYWFDLYRDVCATHTAKSGNQSRDTEALELDAAGNPVQPGDAMAGVPPRYRGIVTEAGEDKVHHSAGSLPIRRQLESFGARLRDPRMNFIFRCGLWMPSQPEKQPEADLDAFLKSWLGSPAPITILDLSSVPESVLDTVIGSSVRLIFDALYWARDDPEGGRRRPMLLVLEEAHRYLKRDGGGRAMQVVQKVVREGRKYGVGMMAVSQRPSELDPTVLSQCGTLVAMRLTNTSDQGAISSAASDTAGGLVSLLPVLRTGEAIMIGEAASLPLRIRVDQPPTERRPRSDDPLVFDTRPDFGWNQASPESRDYVPVVKNWRKNAQ